MEEVIVRYSEGFSTSLGEVIDSLSIGNVRAAEESIDEKLNPDEVYQLCQVIETFEMLRSVRDINTSHMVRVIVTGTFAVGKTELCSRLVNKINVPAFIVTEDITRNHALDDSVNAQDGIRPMAIFQSQLHFLRQVYQETVKTITILDKAGGKGLIINDQSETAHKAIRESKVEYDILRREDCDLLDKLDRLFHGIMPKIATTEVFLVAHPDVIRQRVENRAKLDPARIFELENEVYKPQNLALLQNALLKCAGDLALKPPRFVKSPTQFEFAKSVLTDEFIIMDNKIFIDTTALNDPELVYSVVITFLVNDRRIDALLREVNPKV